MWRHIGPVYRADVYWHWDGNLTSLRRKSCFSDRVLVSETLDESNEGELRSFQPAIIEPTYFSMALTLQLRHARRMKDTVGAVFWYMYESTSADTWGNDESHSCTGTFFLFPYIAASWELPLRQHNLILWYKGFARLTFWSLKSWRAWPYASCFVEGSWSKVPCPVLAASEFRREQVLVSTAIPCFQEPRLPKDVSSGMLKTEKDWPVAIKLGSQGEYWKSIDVLGCTELYN